MSTKRATKSRTKAKPATDYSEKPECNWVDVTEEFNKEPEEKLEIPPFTSHASHGEHEFHAVGVFLDILGQRHVPYVAMFVTKGEETVNKLVEMDEAAHRFLGDQGLPITAAKALVALAAALRDEEPAKTT